MKFGKRARKSTLGGSVLVDVKTTEIREFPVILPFDPLKQENIDSDSTITDQSSLTDPSCTGMCHKSLMKGSFDPNEHVIHVHVDKAVEVTKASPDAYALLREFPNATLEECIRFLHDRKYCHAKEKMDKFLQWRKEYLMDHIPDGMTFENDEQVFMYAITHGLKSFPDLNKDIKLPRFIRIISNQDGDAVKSKSGKRIVQVFSNMIDPDIAPLAFYALVYSIYFYLHLPRNSLEDVVVVADVRKGEGWANCSPYKIMPFIKQAASHMELFPRCLSKCHVYPVPSFAKVIWHTIRSFLKEIVVKKVDLHWGSSSITSAIPQSLEEHFDQNTIKDFERHRRSEFTE